MITTDKRSITCTKCGGDGGPDTCPVYHGMRGGGFCPMFWDGETAFETATRFYDWWLTATEENIKLRTEVQRLKARNLLVWLFRNEKSS